MDNGDKERSRSSRIMLAFFTLAFMTALAGVKILYSLSGDVKESLKSSSELQRSNDSLRMEIRLRDVVDSLKTKQSNRK